MRPWYTDPEKCNKLLRHLVATTSTQEEGRRMLDSAIDKIWSKLNARTKKEA